MENKNAAANEQFATIGGVARMTLCAEQHHLALVQAFAIPPPAASCYHVRCKWRATQRQRATESQWWKRLPRSGNRKEVVLSPFEKVLKLHPTLRGKTLAKPLERD